MPKSEQRSVLLDTSFFIRLLNDEDKLHNNAVGYYRYFLEHKYCLKISTIAIAEFCVKAEITDLPLRNLQILPFNYNHGIRGGDFTRIVIENKREKGTAIYPRAVVPNDCKMFAQADVEQDVEFFVSSDSEAKKVISLLKDKTKINFRFLDINIPYNQVFGELGL